MLQDSKTLKDLSIFSDNLLTIHTAMYPHYSGKILFECIEFLTGDHNRLHQMNIQFSGRRLHMDR